jgi:hypothetical protein
LRPRGLLQASQGKVNRHGKVLLNNAAEESSFVEGEIAEGTAEKKARPSGMHAGPAKINDRAIYPPLGL